MIINFTFKNYRSFRDEAQFSMERDGEKSPDGWGHPEVSTVSAIYGPNASGKSALLKAIDYVRRMVSNSYVWGDRTSGVNTDPFLLDPESCTAPSEFFIDFFAGDGLRYKYWFAADANQVLNESLMVYRSARPAKLFERWVDDENGGQRIEFGASFSGPKKQLWKLARPNSLFLSVIGASSSGDAFPAFDELAHNMGFYSAPAYGSETSVVKRLLKNQNKLGESLSSIIQQADFGVRGISVREKEPDEFLRQSLLSIGERAGVEKERLDVAMSDASNELVFCHSGKDDSIWFEQDRESDGTVAALSFLSVSLRTLVSGGVALVDEMDSSLHPVLVDELVRVFADPETNPLQAQLIFTTHDVSLITKSGRDGRAIQRDQLWFVEKGEGGASDLYPASSLHLKPDENMGRNYINGVYGALPNVGLHRAMANAVGELIESEGLDGGRRADGTEENGA